MQEKIDKNMYKNFRVDDEALAVERLEASVEILKAYLKSEIEYLEDRAKSLRELLKVIEETPKEVIESPNANFLAKGSQVYARFLRYNGELQVFPIKRLQIKVNDRAIVWLRNKVYSRASEKHGFKFEFVNENGLLSAIKVHGLTDEAEVSKLLKATLWALEKASERR